MSAKVIKCLDPAGFSPLPIPALGGSGEIRHGEGSFIVPPLDPSTIPVQEPLPEPVAAAETPEEVLENARREAARIIAEAEEAKALLQQAALEQAQLEAAAAMDAEIERRLQEMRSEMAESFVKLGRLSADIVGHVESDLVELAVQIARKIVRREVTIDRDIALTLVRVSLSKLNQRTAAEVHLNPEDLAYINSRLDAVDFRGALTLIEDPTVSPGGCLVHTETGDIDARIESQFDEISFGLLH